MIDYEICDCGNKAIWMYAPSSSSKENPFYCDDCVPRGCSCNNLSTRDEDYHPYGGIAPTEEDNPIKWIDEHTWCRLDDKGREYPCCEYWYDEEGFEKDDEEENQHTGS